MKPITVVTGLTKDMVSTEKMAARDPRMRVVEEGRELRLAVAELFLGLHPVGDVDQDHPDMRYGAVPVADRKARGNRVSDLFARMERLLGDQRLA